MTYSNERIVAAARGWLGTPYRHQASIRSVGADCLGLVRGIWREVIGTEPEAIPAYPRLAPGGDKDELLLDAFDRYFRPVIEGPTTGHVLLFRLRPLSPVRHCGILARSGRLIHAVERRGTVEIELDQRWQRRLAAVFAFPEVN